MTDKVIVTEVRSDDDNFAECCSVQSFVTVLTPQLKKRIVELSDLVNSVGAYYITEFDSEGRWSTIDPETLLEDKHPETAAAISTIRVESQILHVSATKWWYDAVVKWTNIAMNSERQLIDWRIDDG